MSSRPKGPIPPKTPNPKTNLYIPNNNRPLSSSIPSNSNSNNSNNNNVSPLLSPITPLLSPMASLLPLLSPNNNTRRFSALTSRNNDINRRSSASNISRDINSSLSNIPDNNKSSQLIIKKLYHKNIDLYNNINILKLQLSSAYTLTCELIELCPTLEMQNMLTKLLSNLTIQNKSNSPILDNNETKDLQLDIDNDDNVSIASNTNSDNNNINNNLLSPTAFSISPGPRSIDKRAQRDAFLLEGKERIIAKLSAQLEKSALKILDLEKSLKSMPSFTPKPDKITDRIKDDYITMRKENQRSIMDKLTVISNTIFPNSNFSAMKPLNNINSDTNLDFLRNIPKEFALLIVEQAKLLAQESTTRQMIEHSSSMSRLALEQERAEMYVSNKLLISERDELKLQLNKKDEIDRQISTKVMSMMEKLKDLENENMRLQYLNSQLQQNVINEKKMIN